MNRYAAIVAVFAAAFLLYSCEKAQIPFIKNGNSRVLILFTNDEHGHFYERDGRYKAAILAEMWEEEEKKCPGCIVLKISGGDSYTGSAPSSIFKGESMADLMAQLGYKISAVGNHEFDYGILPFEKNRSASKMRYLSANLLGKDLQPVFEPSALLTYDTFKIGIVAVTTEELKQISFSAFLKDVKVVQSRNAAGRELRKLKDLADLRIAIAHEDFESSRKWVSSLPKNERPLIVLNGHSHEEYVKEAEGVTFVQGKKYLEKYARIELQQNGKVVKIVSAEVKALNKTLTGNSQYAVKIKESTDRWLAKADAAAGKVIAAAGEDIPTDRFMKLYTCSLLESYPEGDVALSNPGAFRDEIKKGYVKLSDIISMMPFENRVVISEIPGKELIYNLNLAEEAVCGMIKKDNVWYQNGAEVEPAKLYKAVIHEYIYNGGDYFKFIGTGISNTMTNNLWRTPLIDFISRSSNDKLSLEAATKNLLIKYGIK